MPHQVFDRSANRLVAIDKFSEAFRLVKLKISTRSFWQQYRLSNFRQETFRHAVLAPCLVAVTRHSHLIEGQAFL